MSSAVEALNLTPDNTILGKRNRIANAVENARTCRAHLSELNDALDELDGEDEEGQHVVEVYEIRQEIREIEQAAASWENLADRLGGDE